MPVRTAAGTQVSVVYMLIRLNRFISIVVV